MVEEKIDPAITAHQRELMELRRNSGLEVICCFCKEPLVPRELSFGGRTMSFGYNSCECAEYVAAQAKIMAEEVAKEGVREAVLRQEKINKLFVESNLGARFRDRTFANYKAESSWQKNALRIAAEFAAEMSENGSKRGLIFSGDVGTGKTHLAAAIGNAMINSAIPVLFGTSSGLLSQIRQGWKDDSDARIVRMMCQVPLLIIDDLGKEYSKKNSDGWSWAQEQFFMVINSRYENYLPVVITTNLSPDELSELLGKAIVSRLVESCRGVKCDGEDYRLKMVGR